METSVRYIRDFLLEPRLLVQQITNPSATLCLKFPIDSDLQPDAELP